MKILAVALKDIQTAHAVLTDFPIALGMFPYIPFRCQFKRYGFVGPILEMPQSFLTGRTFTVLAGKPAPTQRHFMFEYHRFPC